ncbi:acyl-CoA dehydrogenase [Geomonas sp. Red32]|uniref:acyl-CoA dehydrogenase n=1 Tax=Geomonas sp. Red32 TaxID=2912856 RepID=UPI00202CCCEF|nr:acyl-CoA dehydrogenase [Geomonas sp. Red32]MCM0082171.1 acyl-CoA dehydrogenase [Geomonas sp. Red32]
MMLFNPKKLAVSHPDPVVREIVEKTVAFFEAKGKKKLKEDDLNRVWYQDFIDFVKKEKIFATLLTPAGYGGSDCRWDTSRLCVFNEVVAFYGLCYWYVWQVSILGLSPVWMSRNEEVRRKAAALLDDGAIFAFGLSEKEHGADIYSTDMELIPNGEGKYLARGDKYYIGNGNEAALVSTFGRIPGTSEYVFFAVDSKHEAYECVKNITATQSYVSEFILHDYPIAESDIISRGDLAWDSSLNTVNVGKYNLGWASIGICTHAFYEAINHASNRRLYDRMVTDFPHVKQMFTDAYARLVAMKLFALRASDYFRSASPTDRRYLLYNPVMKMKVTTQGEDVINLLWDVIAAKGFEKDTYFDTAARDIRALPKLEGTVHVNIALILKFMVNYFFNPGEYPLVPRRLEAANDGFLFDQGPTKGLGSIRFHDYRKVYDSCQLANVRIFVSQIEALSAFLRATPPDEAQQRDIDFMLALGELFTLVVYGQLVLENAALMGIGDDLLAQIFDFMVRDFSRFALQLYSKTSTTSGQMEGCLKMIAKPEVDEARYLRVWNEQVLSLSGCYEMSE